MNEAANIVGSGRVQQVEGALNVGLHIHVGRYVAKRNGDQSGQVHDGVLPGGQLVHVIRVTDVSEHDLERTLDVCWQGVEPAPRAL